MRGFVMGTRLSGAATQLGSAHLLIVFLFTVASVSSACSTSMSIGPSINGGTLWLDPNSPNTNSPSIFVQQGMVVTIPTDVSVLSTASFYVSPETATYFKLQIYNWSSSVFFSAQRWIVMSILRRPVRYFMIVDRSHSHY
jgi:hypothetical protein